MLALRRMRDALAVAREEARAIEDDPRPFARLLAFSIVAGEDTLKDIDRALRQRAGPRTLCASRKSCVALFRWARQMPAIRARTARACPRRPP